MATDRPREPKVESAIWTPASCRTPAVAGEWPLSSIGPPSPIPMTEGPTTTGTPASASRDATAAAPAA